MKKFLVLAVVLLAGCGHVTQAELRTSQDALRTELRGEIAEQSVANLECVQMQSVAGQANMLCQLAGAYCEAVQAYVDHCVREDSSGATLPPRPGVMEAMDRLIEEENARHGGQGDGSVEVPSEPTTETTE